MTRKRPPDLTPLKNLAKPRRRRVLDGEEQTLWETVTKEIKPLRKRRKTQSPPIIEAIDTVEAESLRVATQTAIPAPAVLPRVTKAASPPPLAPIGRRERSQLSKGRKEIEARLDLHGMTQDRAHRVLLAFLSRASADGLSFVLVITGKGRSGAAESERGVLRRQVPEWLSLPEFRKLVIGFEEASIGHGGAGALYVRVRRGRS